MNITTSKVADIIGNNIAQMEEEDAEGFSRYIP